MKYFFTTLVLTATLLSSNAISVHAANNCPVINPSDGSCCTDAKTQDQITACQNYFDGNNGTDTPVSGQINGGAPSTGPVNSGAYNGSLFSSSTAADAAVASCSAIKFTNLLNIAIWAKCIIGAIVIPGIFSLAFVFFLWGVFKFIRATADKDKQEGKQFIYMGLIGLFVMVSVWGIIKIATKTVGFDSTVPMLQQSDPLSTSKVTK